MEYDDIVSYWGPQLVRFDAKDIHNLPLHPDDKWFLEHVGIPHLPEPHIIQFWIHPEKIQRKLHDETIYVVIGEDDETEIGIRISDRAIISFTETQQYPPSLVNRNLHTFIRFLTRYEQIGEIRAKSKSIMESDMLTSRLENEFKSIDPEALDDEENWWSLILEQLYHGLL